MYFVFCTIFILSKLEDFSTWFFEPESTDETHKTENHEKERPIHEAPEEIKIETQEIDSYPEKCLWDNVGFSESDTNPNSSSEDCDVEDIESETSHVRIVEHFCDVDTESVYPACQKNKKETKLSIGSMYRSKSFCFPLKEQSDSEEVKAHTKWPEHKCFFFWFDPPHTISKSEFQMKPGNVEKCMNNREGTEWNDKSKWYREKKPGKKESC